eukprot:TRINITY_DN211_c0_g1_i1.p1 TRINITY_DN211_c0_g1~~TRINITY_DN211_c0_g1_i1.p1  ORF type:complete len:221 (-),score=44.67 TRINITY_DN211_c0_g1_i1:1609-2271(-)
MYFVRSYLKPSTSSFLRAYHCLTCSHATESKQLTLFCGKCSTILRPPKSLNYFKLLGLEKETFVLDIRALSKEFKRLQVHLHPDKYALKIENNELELAEQWSSLVNEAYSTLKSPVQRCLYLLELSGKPLVEDEVQMSPEFLMEVMELNEELEDDIACADDLDSFNKANDGRLEEYFKDFNDAWTSGQPEEARVHAAKIKYIDNLRGKIRETEERLGIIR